MSSARSGSGRRPATASDAYRVEIASEVRLAHDGLACRTPAGERLVGWGQIGFAVAAEVGEPEGVRTIVFDLVIGRDEAGWHALRIDAEPGPSAEKLARWILAGVGVQRRGPSIKSLAGDGVASWWYPDLESFEAAVRRVLPAWTG